MKKATIFLGAALAAGSLAMAAPAAATPAPTPGSTDAAAVASAAPGSLGTEMQASEIYVQDASAHLDGARIGVGSTDGFYSKAATDGTVTLSTVYKPAL